MPTTRAWSTCATSTTYRSSTGSEIQHFFEIYKTLEPGKSVEGATWVGRADAEREIKLSWQRAKDAAEEH